MQVGLGARGRQLAVELHALLEGSEGLLGLAQVGEADPEFRGCCREPDFGGDPNGVVALQVWAALGQVVELAR